MGACGNAFVDVTSGLKHSKSGDGFASAALVPRGRQIHDLKCPPRSINMLQRQLKRGSASCRV